MYYVITKSGMKSSSSLEKLNNMLDAKLEDEEFKCCGADKIVELDDVDLEFIRDKRRMSAIAFQNFFMKDTRPTMYFIVQLIIMFIILIGVFSK